MLCSLVSVNVVCCFLFFKQKTAYEMRISDWSSDVCSSDLACEQQDVPREHAASASCDLPLRRRSGRATLRNDARELLHVPLELSRVHQDTGLRFRSIGGKLQRDVSPGSGEEHSPLLCGVAFFEAEHFAEVMTCVLPYLSN